MDKSRAYSSTIYDEHKKEKAERRGTGFVGFLSDLDWMLSLELEEGRPLDETKITTAQKFWVFNQGLKFGIEIHFAILFLMSIALYSLLWSFKIENEWLIHAIFGLNLLFSLAVKLAIPLWLLEDYYVFPKGITHTYLSWFFFGYSIGLFIPEFFYILIISLFMGIYWILKESIDSQWFFSLVQIIDKYLPHYADFKWLPFHFIFLLFSFAPMWLIKIWRKKKPMETYPWTPLDFIPKDD